MGAIQTDATDVCGGQLAQTALPWIRHWSILGSDFYVICMLACDSLLTNDLGALKTIIVLTWKKHNQVESALTQHIDILAKRSSMNTSTWGNLYQHFHPNPSIHSELLRVLFWDIPWLLAAVEWTTHKH